MQKKEKIKVIIAKHKQTRITFIGLIKKIKKESYLRREQWFFHIYMPREALNFHGILSKVILNTTLSPSITLYIDL